MTPPSRLIADLPDQFVRFFFATLDDGRLGEFDLDFLPTSRFLLCFGVLGACLVVCVTVRPVLTLVPLATPLADLVALLAGVVLTV